MTSHRSAFLLTLGSVLFALVSGCHSQAVDDRADKELSDLHASTNRAVVYPSCHDSSPIGPTCGLVTKHVSSDAFRARFREKRCADATPEICDARFGQMVDTELTGRYFAADMRAIERTCRLRPHACDDPKTYELYLLDSHNANVRDRHAKGETAIEDDRQRAQRERAAPNEEMRAVLMVASAVTAKSWCFGYPGAFAPTVMFCH